MNSNVAAVLVSSHNRLYTLERAEGRFFITGSASPDMDNDCQLNMLCEFRFMLQKWHVSKGLYVPVEIKNFYDR